MRSVNVLNPPFCTEVTRYSGSMAALLKACLTCAESTVIRTEITEKPSDLHIREGAGKTVLWRHSVDSFVAGKPTGGQKDFATSGTYTFAV